MNNRSKLALSAAIDRLADLVPDGALLAATNPAGLLDAVVDLLAAREARFARENGELRHRLDEANRKRAKLCEQLAHVKRSASGTDRKLREEIAVLREQLATAQARLAESERRLAALRDQVERGGCAAAHLGETTYECDATRPCGLCRLRARTVDLYSLRELASIKQKLGYVRGEEMHGLARDLGDLELARDLLQIIGRIELLFGLDEDE